MKRMILLLVLMLAAFLNEVAAQQPAFPGAEGAGAFTTGGRGTAGTPSTVFEVTSLDDTNTPGTLRYAISTNVAYRTIVFRVSGTIHLLSALKIKANTTIAGQSAPGDGICLADHPVQVAGDNVIIRYIRCRLGDKNQNKGMVNGSGDDDALDVSGTHSNIIIDHCSVSWSNDEAMTFYDGDNLTLQWNIISEPLNYSYHFETGDADFEHHGYGGIWGGKHASFHHNLFAHCISRTPRFNGNRYFTPAIENAELVNNVIYNWGGNNVYGGEGGNYNVVGNYYKYGPSTTSKNRIVNPNKQTTAPVLPFGKYFITGNYMDGSTTITNNNWRGVVMGNGAPTSDTALIKAVTPFVISSSGITIQGATDAYASVLSKAGASLPNRDTLDERIMNNVIDRTGSIIDVQGGYPHGTPYPNTVNAWPKLVSLPAPTDNDHDGMADEWELQRKLNPSAAADRNGYHANGYTNLENYLNGDSIVAAGTKESCIHTRPVLATGSNSWLWAKDSSYTRLVSTDTMNVVAAIKDDGNYGSFDINYFTTASTRFYGNGKAYLNRGITIVPADPGAITGPVTIRLFLLKSELDSLMKYDVSVKGIADVRILKLPGNDCATAISSAPQVIFPTTYGEYGTYKTGYFLEMQVSSFSSFYFGGDPGVLPLRLLSFTGVISDHAALLQWTTANESSIEHFVIEKSSDGNHFSTVGKVAAANTMGKRSYAFSDDGFNEMEASVFYRIKILDVNGTVTYSQVIKLSTRKAEKWWLSPNPAKDRVTVNYPVGASSGMITLFAADGRKVLKQKITSLTTQAVIYLQGLQSGTYFVSIDMGSGTKTLPLFVE